MRPSQVTGIALGAFFAVSATAFAQTPPTQPPPTQTPPPQTEPAQAQTKTTEQAPTQTFAGCVMTERDYRAAHNLGAGQVGGVGIGDEYVLVDVKMSPAKADAAASTTEKPAATAAASTAATPSATVTSKCEDKGTAYRLTGSDEGQLKTLVGRHVEIQGRFKNAGDAAGSGARPEGTLPAEVEIVSFIEAPASATAAPAATPQTVPPASPPVTAPPATQTQPTTPPATQPAPRPTTPTAPAQVTPREPATTPATAERRELPATASSTALLALVGVVALSSGFALSMMRRRSVQ